MNKSDRVLRTVGDAVQHMQSGDARFRLLSYASNNSYQYRMKENQTGRKFFVYLVATTGELAFMGLIIDGEFQRTDRSKVNSQAPAYRAFDWVWRNLCRHKMPPQVVIEAL